MDTPMRTLIRKYPDLAVTVLDQCFKEWDVKTVGNFVDMNFEFIDDSFNYRFLAHFFSSSSINFLRDLGLQERKDEGTLFLREDKLVCWQM